ncbi:efflux RND transporter periplasmic adaptor subunit [candidate division KSB1 bacterium]|nr:efflux RND transporter periplasmic adaptor subunit [candidate division KSB1 bacterium]
MNRISTYVLLGLFALALMLQFHCSNENVASKNKSRNTNQESKKDSSHANNDERKKEKEEELVPVEITSVKRGAISSYILLSSNLETEKMVDIYSRVQGLVKRIAVEEGEPVKKGQVLLELEADEFMLAEQKAKVNFQQAEKGFERINSMYAKELLSKEEFEQAKYKTEAAKIEWQQAQLNLDYTKITSPIDGVVVERLIRLGDRIQPVDKLFSVINKEEMIAIVHVPEKEIERISKGQKAYITSNHILNQRFEGWIKRVSPAVDPQSGTFKVTIGVNNKEDKLRPGMFVNAHIITDTHLDALLIPKTAIVYENEYMNVFVVRDSIAQKIMLKVGFQDHVNVESLEGIEAGEKVIVVGQSGLKDRTKVKAVLERES